MKINSSMASFYNASSRVNSADYNKKVLATEEIASKNLTADVSTAQSGAQKQEYQAPVALKQTRVSPENSYQKQMINDPRFAVERMAGKLMDKLPNILADMKNLPDTNSIEAAAPKADVASKVIIRENSAVDFQSNQANLLQDISL